MGKLFTFGEAKAQLGKYVDNGSCNTTTVSQRINEAIQRLIAKPVVEQSPRLNFLVKLQIYNREFALPRGVEKIIAANLNGTPGHVFNKMYQFLSSGQGDQDCAPFTQCARHIMDLGEFPYQYAIPNDEDNEQGLKLMAATTKPFETVKLKVWGFDYMNRELYEELSINSYQASTEGSFAGALGTDILVSTHKFKEITKVVKEATSATVNLYAVDVDTNKMWFIGKYHAKDTLPMFRRYRIVNKEFRSGIENEERTGTCILAMVKMGYEELSEDDDIVPIDSVSALKLMVIALKYENEGNLPQSNQYEANAVRVLEDAVSHNTQAQGTPVIIDFERQLMGGRANRWPYI